MTHLQNYEVINLPFRNGGLSLLDFEGHTGNTLKKRLPPDWQCQLWMTNLSCLQLFYSALIPASQWAAFLCTKQQGCLWTLRLVLRILRIALSVSVSCTPCITCQCPTIFDVNLTMALKFRHCILILYSNCFARITTAMLHLDFVRFRWVAVAVLIFRVPLLQS